MTVELRWQEKPVLHLSLIHIFYVTGGLARMKGLAEYIEGRTGIKAQVVKNPDLCVVEVQAWSPNPGFVEKDVMLFI